MISFFPFQTMFLSTLFSGTLIALAAPSWFLAWLGLEVNLLSFIPLMTATAGRQETEGATKYFLSQATGSTLILIGSTLPPLENTLIIVFGLLIKLGVPPGHFWFPSVMASLPWTSCILLATWQKVAPLSLMAFSCSLTTSAFLFIIAAGSSLLGGFMGMNQSQLRPLLAYSSIGHLGWMIMLSTVSPNAAATYFVIYSTISITIMLMLSLSSLNSLHSLSSPLNSSAPLKLLLTTLLLSLGGLPPLLGFMPKLLTLHVFAASSLLIAALPLIFGSLINLFYYLSFSFALILPTNTAQLTPRHAHTSPPLFLSILVTLSLGAGLLLPPFL
uniref:NADH-ubiquinone oxidoreductase chain 2 n=1 Tax=Sipunculus nudus TaxID=6446 RepID=A0A140CAJ1_SIPNU|nr:NADH dehydrogenase subunit 2 [Sipunculus nudus]